MYLINFKQEIKLNSEREIKIGMGYRLRDDFCKIFSTKNNEARVHYFRLIENNKFKYIDGDSSVLLYEILSSLETKVVRRDFGIYNISCWECLNL